VFATAYVHVSASTTIAGAAAPRQSDVEKHSPPVPSRSSGVYREKVAFACSCVRLAGTHFPPLHVSSSPHALS